MSVRWTELVGVSAALGAAVAWAVCSLLFRAIGEKVSAQGMNFIKCVLGVIYLGIVLALTGTEPVSLENFFFLGMSGLIGIALGDSFFFRALKDLGPRQTLLIETLGPVVTVLLAVAFLRERPFMHVWVGMAMTLGGVTWVLWEQSPASKRKGYVKGVIYGLIFVLCNSIGIIFAKIGVNNVSSLQATGIRFLWASAGLLLWGGASRQLGRWIFPCRDFSVLKSTIIAVTVAIFGGFWFSLAALKYIPVSIATTLSLTTPVFILPLAAIFLKEKITAQSVFGALVAVGGIAIIFL